MTGDALVGPGRNHDPDALRQLVQQIQDLRHYVDDKSSQILRTAGLRAEPDLLRVLGSLVVEGDMSVSGTETVSGNLSVSGTETVSGSLVVEGDLSVPSGVIKLAGVDQDLATAMATLEALVSQQMAVAIAPTVTVGTWTVSTSQATKASTSVAVPSGYTRALVVARANMHFQDSSPNGGWLRAVIAGNAGSEMGGLANLNIGQSADHTLSMNGLSGGTLSLETQVRASVASSVTTGRIAQIGGFAIFLR